MTFFSFRLFLLGDSSRSRAAEQALRRLCADRFGDSGFSIEVVNVEEHRDVADAARIVATPTLDLIAPLPRIRVIGDLSSSDELAATLGLPAAADRPSLTIVPDLPAPAGAPDDQEDPS